MPTIDHTKVLLFDGVCNLCNAAVRFIIARDSKKRFRFASLQSEFAQRLLHEKQYTTDPLASLVYIRNGQVLIRSAAALNIARDLGGFWAIFHAFIIVPRPIRDAVYDLIAKYRYSWFGKQEECMVPTPELRTRFLDQDDVR